MNLPFSELMRWYDHNQRQLPWRAQLGDIANPYYVLLSEFMLQQTTVATVKNYFYRFISRWPTLEALAQAPLNDVYYLWQGLGYYSRAQNLHRCAQSLIKDWEGKLPQTPPELASLPGIGPYTSAAIAAIAFNYPVLPVDGNITRVISRLQGSMTPLPQLKSEIQQWAQQNPSHERPGDLAQALMDLGATVCKPRNPLCNECPLTAACLAHQTTMQKHIPIKGPAKTKPTRYGQVFIYFNDQNQIQLRQRPNQGLLANLFEFPTTLWEEKPNYSQNLSTTIKHTFTHFHLILEVTTSFQSSLEKDCFWISPQELRNYALPTVMWKVWQKYQSFYNKSQ